MERSEPSARALGRMTAVVERAPTLALVLIVALGVSVMSCQSWLAGLGLDKSARVADAAPELPTTEPELRVRIRTGLTGATLDGPSRFVVTTDVDQPLAVMGPLGVACEAGSITVTDGDGRRRLFGAWTPVFVSPEAARDGKDANILIDGAPFPGRLRLHPRPGTATTQSPTGGTPTPPSAGAAAKRGSPGVFDIVELVLVESYLPGVVSGELWPNWPLAAYEAQSVVARTYALHQRHVAMRRGRDYDLEANTQDQVYKGFVETPVAVQGVRNTRGVVVTWRGKLLRTYYASTCGGRTASAADVWPTTEGYEYNLYEPIQAASRDHWCTQSTLYRWEVTRETDELTRRIREWGKGNGHDVAGLSSLVSVTVARANADGRPARYRLRDAKGTPFELSAEQLRLACNQSVAGVPDVALRKTRAASNDFEVEIKGKAVTIRGRGFGHGVGLCQWCIKGMADRGYPWRQMVPRFYPGATLERAY
ncbi:MAG: SpoIID/LytB domain-containing protein [Phycisphaerales bacterium]